MNTLQLVQRAGYGGIMSWYCKVCLERHSDQFQSCWKCGADRSGKASSDTVYFGDAANEVDQNDLKEGALPFDEMVRTQAQPANESKPSPTPIVAERNPPIPYLYRFNRYFGRQDSTPIPTYDRSSRMPFYMSKLLLVRYQGKSAEYIRQILERIRETIRSCRIRT